MDDSLRRLPLTDIDRPRISLRPVRRETLEYLELVDSVRKDGVLQPILVRPRHCIGCSEKSCVTASCVVAKQPRFDLVEGWHRYEAAKEAGLTEIPCLIREMSDNEVLIFQIKCNSIRPVTRSFEYARRLIKLMRSGYTMPELSGLINKSPKWIKDQLQLNRLCEEARPAVERGEIKMAAALALANLPAELQPKFIDDAIAMSTAEFVERANMAARDFKAYLLQQQEEDRKIGAARPLIRAQNILKREALKPKNAHNVLRAAKAKTALDGWEACMAWIFRLDPISVKNRKENRKEKEGAIAMNRAEYERTNREMIDKFVKPQSNIGDYSHGE